QKTAYVCLSCLVGSEMFIIDSYNTTLDNVFSELIAKKEFINFLSAEYPRDVADKINNDILTILSNI
ncbi:MAG: hypothetical protein K2J40_10670, partial [Ruminococcus sp.]|nr:hypothetical protein [Ruminococcus sp.]